MDVTTKAPYLNGAGLYYDIIELREYVMLKYVVVSL